MNIAINAAYQSENIPSSPADVLRIGEGFRENVAALLQQFGLQLVEIDAQKDIPGSYWGDEEAGLIENRLLVREDTPLHSILHEACHYLCMDKQRRANLDTDAGGDYDEENAVCYLQILLADHIPAMGRDRMFIDMDLWGYTFRLGSSRAWFESDAQDACEWLVRRKLVTADNRVIILTPEADLQ